MLFLLAFVVSSLAFFHDREHSDVCVLGAGAGGAYAAWKLSLKGHSVALFDTADRVGGNCETYVDFTKNVVVPLGVVLYPAIDFVKDIITAAGLTYSEFDLSRTEDPAFIDFRTGEAQKVEMPSDEEFYLSYAALLDIFETRYPEMDGIGGGYPAHMPEELAGSLGDFMENNGLNGLMRVVRFLSPGYDHLNMPAYFGLKLLRPVALNLLSPGGSIAINEGCDAFYQAITQPVEKVVLDAKIHAVVRGRFKSHIFYRVGRKLEHQTCKKLIVAYRPSTDSMSNVYPKSREERSLYAEVETGIFGTGVFSFSADRRLNALHWNYHAEENQGFPTLPNTILLQITGVDADRTLYANGQMSARTPQDIDTVIENFKKDLATIPGIVSEITPIETKLHPFAYQPNQQAAIDGFFGRMEALQGERNTWFVGSTMSFESQFDCWAYSERIVAQIDAQLSPP